MVLEKLTAALQRRMLMIRWRSALADTTQVLLRGCRCIEIDVWNSDDVTPTTVPKSDRADHQRGLSGFSVKTGISGNSIPYAADALHATVGNIMGEKSTTPSRSRSSTRSKVVDNDEDISPRTSTLFNAETKDSADKLDASNKLERPRSRTQMPKGEPIVTHGWTPIAPCGFREVCKAIAETAFDGNDLPIIISLEVHADDEQQAVMVRIMKEEWGEMLVDAQFDDCDPKFRLPKLENLRRKILVKVKRAPAKMIDLCHGNTVNIPIGSSALEDTSDSEDDDEKPPPPPKKADSEPLSNGTGTTNTQSTKPEIKTPAFPICETLSNLAIYTRSEKFRGFNTPEAKRPPHIFSISEAKLMKLNEEHHSDMFKHNKSFFVRAYPANWRINSSNPDPSLLWRKGVQMVAMNWQRLDKGMMLNEGMFADEQGYVLKPPGYLSSNKSAETQHEAVTAHTLDLTITVFAGWNIPVQPDSSDSSRGGNDLNPQVSVELHVEKVEDHKTDAQMQAETHQRETNVGRTDRPEFDPRRSKLHFKVPKIVPELGFAR